MTKSSNQGGSCLNLFNKHINREDLRVRAFLRVLEQVQGNRCLRQESKDSSVQVWGKIVPEEIKKVNI